MESPKEKKSAFREGIDNRLKRIERETVDNYVKKYAKNPDGSPSPELAGWIEREVTRRATMGRELDIYEPIRWTIASFAITSAIGLAMHAFAGREFARKTIGVLLATTFLNSAYQFGRLESRWKAGLKGGLETAFAMHELEKRKMQDESLPQR